MTVFSALPSNLSGRKLRFRMVIPGFPRFNVYSRVARYTTALGPTMIATVVSKMADWEAEIIDENNFSRHGIRGDDGFPDHSILQRIRQAAVVGIYGGLSSTAARIAEVARFYRDQNVLIVAGGQHFVEENLREGLDWGIDYISLGEGEDTIKELLDALRDGVDPMTVPGLAFYRDGVMVKTAPRGEIMDIDRLPLPDFSLLRHASMTLYPVGWTRGCGMNCEFCTVKGNVRCPSPDYVFDQITSLFERMNAREFFIVDDLFGQHRAPTLELCRRLTEYQETANVNFFITVQIRLDRAKDTELLMAMRQASIKVVAIGYESPIGEELAAMNKKLNAKDMVNYTRMYHQAGLMVHGMFIFGYPSRPGQEFHMAMTDRVRTFRKFIRQARIDTIQIMLPVPLPGTELTRRLTEEGRIFSREIIGWEYYDGNFPLFVPDAPLTAEELRYGQKKLMSGFYRFSYMFSIGFNILLFPAIICSSFSLNKGWRRWYRSFRNSIWRFIGWKIMRQWDSLEHQDAFTTRLEQARRQLH